MGAQEEKLKRVVKAEQTADWLGDVRWEENLGKDLKIHREWLVRKLYQNALGFQHFEHIDANTKVPVTTEQLAGRLAGIDFIEELIKRVINEGQSAEHALQQMVFNPKKSS